MKFYSFDDILEILTFESFTENDCLMVHSSLLNLGLLKDIKAKENAKVLLEFLMKLTENGALLMPNYNYSFPSSKFSDLNTQKSEVGALTELFNQKTKICSNHPMFSINASGKKAKNLVKPRIPEFNPFLDNSSFHRIYKENAIFLFLGIDIRVCTFMVYTEAINGVKYRYFKPFSGTLVSKMNEKMTGDFYHFCMPPSKELRINFHRVQEKMLKENIIKSKDIGFCKSYIFRAQPFFDFVSNEIQKDPYILLENPPKRLWAFVDNEDKIIKELK